MEVSTASGKPYATVMWNIPVTKDNSLGRLNLSGLDPPQTLQVGTTNITYYVTDSAGLGSSCTFSVLVKGNISIMHHQLTRNPVLQSLAKLSHTV